MHHACFNVEQSRPAALGHHAVLHTVQDAMMVLSLAHQRFTLLPSSTRGAIQSSAISGGNGCLESEVLI